MRVSAVMSLCQPHRIILILICRLCLHFHCSDPFRSIMSPKTRSILNLLAFTLNTLETAGVGPFSIHFNQNQDNATISAKYQTIITPHGIAFSIWAIIFLMEAIFCGVTLFNERMGQSRLVIEGVSFWFALGTYCLRVFETCLKFIIAQRGYNI